MKTSVLFVLGALLLSSVCSVLLSPNCCYSVSTRRLKPDQVKSYTHILTDERCDRAAVVFTTTDNTNVCVDPNESWVQNIMKNLDDRLSPFRDFRTSTVAMYDVLPTLPESSIVYEVISTLPVTSVVYDLTPTSSAAAEQDTTLSSGPSHLLWLLLILVAVVMTSVFLLYRKKRMQGNQESTVDHRRSTTESELYENVGPASEEGTYQSLSVDTMDQDQTYSTIRETHA